MKKFIYLLFFLICNNAYSAEYAGKATGFYVNSTDKRVLVKLDTATPECADVSWPFQFGLDVFAAKEWVSMILTAKASGEEIRVGYNPNPNGRCSVNYLYFY